MQHYDAASILHRQMHYTTTDQKDFKSAALARDLVCRGLQHSADMKQLDALAARWLQYTLHLNDNNEAVTKLHKNQTQQFCHL